MADETTDEETASSALNELKSALQRILGARLVKLVLFGSRARGDYRAGSDFDVAIVVRDLDRELKMQLFDEVARIELEYLFPISTLIMDSARYEHLLSHERRIALDIEHEGVPL